MPPKSLAWLFDPEKTQTHQAASQMASHLRSLVRCTVVPVDRHLPGRLEDLEVDAVINLVAHPERARNADAACRLMDIPVAGPGSFALTLVMDRMMLKDFLNIHNLPTPAAYVPRRKAADIARDHRNFGFPAQVSPRRTPAEARMAADIETLVRFVEEIREMQDEAVVEHPAGGKIVCTALWNGQVVGTAESASYLDGSRTIEEIFIPATLLPSTVKTVERMAQRVAELLPGESALLVTCAHDDKSGDCILDVNTSPCLHRDGLFVRIASAYGFSQRDMAMALAQNALSRMSMNFGFPRVETATSA